MIQRVQTVYLAFSILICLLTFYLFPLELEKKEFTGINFPFFFQKYSFISISIINFISIIFYKKRNFQIILNRFSIFLISLIIISFFLNINDIYINEYKIILSAIVNLILIILANKSILKDKKLIDSINRLR